MRRVAAAAPVAVHNVRRSGPAALVYLNWHSIAQRAYNLHARWNTHSRVLNVMTSLRRWWGKVINNVIFSKWVKLLGKRTFRRRPIFFYMIDKWQQFECVQRPSLFCVVSRCILTTQKRQRVFVFDVDEKLPIIVGMISIRSAPYESSLTKMNGCLLLLIYLG